MQLRNSLVCACIRVSWDTCVTRSVNPCNLLDVCFRRLEYLCDLAKYYIYLKSRNLDLKLSSGILHKHLNITIHMRVIKSLNIGRNI